MDVAVAAAPPFMKNGYVVSCEDTREAVIIDPGDEVDALIAHARDAGVTVRHILLTHAHVDHITGVGRAKAAFDVPIWMHRDDQFLYDSVVEHARLFGLKAERQPPVDRFFTPPQQLAFGRLVVDVRHTPGHCPGGVCLAIGPADSDARELFVGQARGGAARELLLELDERARGGFGLAELVVGVDEDEQPLLVRRRLRVIVQRVLAAIDRGHIGAALVVIAGHTQLGTRQGVDHVGHAHASVFAVFGLGKPIDQFFE